MYKQGSLKTDGTGLKKIPRGRKISYRQTKAQSSCLHKLQFQLTGQLSVHQNIRNSAHRIDQTRSRMMRELEGYDKSRSKSVGRVNSPHPQNRQESRANRTPSLNRTSKSISKSQNKSKVSKSKDKHEKRKENQTRKSSKSRHSRPQDSSLNKDHSISKLINHKKPLKPHVFVSGINKEPTKKETKQSNLKRKCINLIHNKFLLEQKNQQRFRAAVKIQAWFRGHLVRKRMQKQYEQLLKQEQLYKVNLQNPKVQVLKPIQNIICGVSVPVIVLKQKCEQDLVNPIGVSPILISQEQEAVEHQKIDKTNWHRLHQLALFESSVSDRLVSQNSQEEIRYSEGITSNWQSVRHYLRLLNGLICMKYLEDFQKNCSTPFGLTPAQKLALLHQERAEIQDEPNIVVFVLPDSIYDEAQELYFKNTNEYSRIHHQAIFDCYNETLARLRPYYKRLGKPYPWALMNFQESCQPQKAMHIAQLMIQECCSCLCGLFPRVTEQSNSFLEAKRQAMLKRTLDKWISQSGNIWHYIEDQMAEFMLQLSNRIANELITEFCKAIVSLQYRRRFIG